MATKKKSAVDWFVQRTSMHGVPSLMKSRSTKARLFWTLVCMIGMGMFFYMLTSLILKYFSYPVVVKVYEVPRGLKLPKISFCNKKFASLVSEVAFAKVLKTNGKTDLGLDEELETPVRTLFNVSRSLYVLKKSLLSVHYTDLSETHLNETELKILQEWSGLREDLLERWLVSTLLLKNPESDPWQTRNVVLLGGLLGDSLVACTNGKMDCNEDYFENYVTVDHLSCFEYDIREGHGIVESNVQCIKNGITFVFMTGGNLLASEFGTVGKDTLWLLPGYRNTFHPSSGSDGIRMMIHSPDVKGYPDLDAIDISPGMDTTIGITSKEFNQLDYPYDECSDYDMEKGHLAKSVEDKLGYKIPKGQGKASYTLVQCRSVCLQRHIWEECGCFALSERLPFLNSSLLCGYGASDMLADPAKYGMTSCFRLENIVREDCKAMFEKMFTDLKCVRKVYKTQDNVPDENEDVFHCNCPLPCKTREYRWTTGTSRWPSPGPELDSAYSSIVSQRVIPYLRMFNDSFSEGPIRYLSATRNKSEIKHNFARVTVYIKSMRVERIEQMPAYSSVDLISDIGGQLGLWVGISAITLCEIFGFLSLAFQNICKCPNKNQQGDVNEDDEDDGNGFTENMV